MHNGCLPGLTCRITCCPWQEVQLFPVPDNIACLSLVMRLYFIIYCCAFVMHVKDGLGCRSHLQGQMSSLESQLTQSQRTVGDLQLQVASLEAERQQLEQALQGAHAEIQTLHGSVG